MGVTSEQLERSRNALAVLAARNVELADRARWAAAEVRGMLLDERISVEVAGELLNILEGGE